MVEEPLVKLAFEDVERVIRPTSGVSGDLGGGCALTLLKGLVDLDLCTLEALEPRLFVPLLIESKSSALPIFSNMALALLKRA